MSCPSAIGVRSTSIGAPAAMVAASGFIWATSGHTVAAAPTAATAPVATKRKSRRVGWSAEDAVVTIPSPFLSAADGTAPDTLNTRPEEAAGARGPRGGRKTAFPPPIPAEQAVQNRSIGTLAVRAQARYRLASVQCTKSASSRDLFNTSRPHFEARHHADRTLPAGHPPEHGNDSSPVRLPGRGCPYYRAGRLSGLGPAFPQGGNGLPRSG